MKLTRFRVQNFRSFVDSGWVECDNVTAIAGVNEAGKSNLLRALWKLNPAFRGDNKILKNDVPIDCFDKIMDSDSMPIFITAEFRLRPYDKELITQKFGKNITFDNVRVSRYLSGGYLVEYPVDIPVGIKSRLDEFVIKIMPGFVYYSNYGNLDSNIYLPQMLAKFNKNGLNTISKSKQRTVKLLLLYIGITPEMLACNTEMLANATSGQMKLTASQLQELTTKQKRFKDLFVAAGERLTKEFNQWWKQGEYKFEFAFDAGNLTIFVTDKSGIRAPLDDRSVGIQWFLSFFLVFTLESQLFFANSIMLLDESGATLHGLAQQDLLTFFDELAKTNQIVYSTHSSFMLPAEHLNRTRVVYKDKSGHSLVSSDMTFREETKSSEAAIVPVSASINMQVSAAVLKDSNPVFVMDEAVQIYIDIFKNYLIETGQMSSNMLKKPLLVLTTTPAGVEGMAHILNRQNILPGIIAEEDIQTKKSLINLQSIYSAEIEKIVQIKERFGANSIEDLVPFEIFNECCGSFLVDVFGKDFVLVPTMPFLEQLDTAEKVKNLPSSFRTILANLVKEYLEQNPKHKSLKSASKVWLKLFEDLY